MISPAVTSAVRTANSHAASLRFPNFPRRWPNPECRMFGDYEAACGICAPSYEDLRQSVLCYPTFKKSPFPMSPGDAYFWKYLANCKFNDVYVIDNHFDICKMNRLISFMGDIPPIQNDERVSVMILTNGRKDLPAKGSDEWEEIREYAQEWERKSLSLKIMDDNDGQLVHDRFVLADGRIWHFGAAVGGMYGGLNAYSGPWEDVSGHLLLLIQRLSKGARELFSCGN